MDDKTTMKVEALYSNGKKVEGTSFNAGSVVKGELVKAKFVLTNTGNIDLIIGDVNPSCKCTVAKKPSEPIKPGGTYVLEASVNTKELSSKKINKSISLTTNTAETKILTITGKIN
jgi:hypothetical protein